LSSIFTKIINGEIPCYKIAESENCIAFLDIFPLKEGHVLVVPKKEVDYLFDLGENDYKALMNFSAKVAKAIKAAVPCNRISMHVIGLEVPHAHVHLVPIFTMNDCNFSNQKLTFSEDQLMATAQKIASKFQSI
jgi:histidine triad (HIT) family protein